MLMGAQLGLKLPCTAKPVLVASAKASASAAIGRLDDEQHVFVVTKGQFSMIDIVNCLLDQAGPADVSIMSWTSGPAENAQLKSMLNDGRATRLRLVLDRSFFTRHPENARETVSTVGAANVRATRTHAKIAIVRGAGGCFVARGSMNLNRNPRFEQADVSRSRAVADFVLEHFDEQWTLAPKLEWRDTRKVDAAFTKSLGGGLADGVVLADDLESFRAPDTLSLLDRIR